MKLVYLYAYSREGLLTNEVQNGVVLSRLHDALGRPLDYVCRSADGPSAFGFAVSYAYDAYGRPSAVEYGFNAEPQRRRVEYAYLPGTDLVSGYASGDFTRSVSYEPDRNLIAYVENSFGDAVVSRFDYTNDEMYDFNGAPVSIDNLFQLLMNSLTNMQTEGKDD